MSTEVVNINIAMLREQREVIKRRAKAANMTMKAYIIAICVDGTLNRKPK
jgi:hypothetical protein